MTDALLDTSVLSELAPGRRSIPALHEWLDRRRTQLFIPAIAVVELEQGIAKLRRLGASERAGRLAAWLERLLTAFEKRVLPIDATVARRAGVMSDAARAAGTHPGVPDVLIAATAAAHGLSVASRNVRHFTALGVPCFDPAVGTAGHE